MDYDPDDYDIPEAPAPLPDDLLPDEHVLRKNAGQKKADSGGTSGLHHEIKNHCP